MPLSDTDKAVCVEAFRLHETAPDTISSMSLGECMRIPGANPTEEQVKQHASGRAEIKLAAFLQLMETQTLHEDPTPQLKDAFAIFDSDGSGLVDGSEFRNVMGNLGERYTTAEIEEMMRVPSMDVEGRITIADLITFAGANK